MLGDDDNHLARETDTEIFMHEICTAVSVDHRPPLFDVFRQLAAKFDGAYSLVFLDALGDMVVARDPLGIKPLCYAVEGPLFAAASESVALMNLGFAPESIKSLPPGEAIVISDGRLETADVRDQSPPRPLLLRVGLFRQRRQHAGRAERLPRPQGPRRGTGPAGDRAHRRGHGGRARARHEQGGRRRHGLSPCEIPSVEGLIRNRYSGRTFIEGSGDRKRKAETKYTPLREVLEGKRVLLVEDSIVRATTLKVLLQRMRQLGQPKEIHVRVACPPIIAPCFYGIDMSTVSELFAPQFMQGAPLTPAIEAKMAARLGADSLRYLPVEAVARAIGFEPGELCRACITGEYPTPCGQELAAHRHRKRPQQHHRPHLRKRRQRAAALPQTVALRLAPAGWAFIA